MSIICIGAVSAHATVSTTMADEITLFENMGLDLPEKTNETDLVTRGEFIGTITQLLNREFVPSKEYSFTDVPATGDLSGKVSYAVTMGIVSDDTKFNPDANVTYNQAIKMAVAFLGRGAEAEYYGGYDGGGYSAVASTLKLYSGLQDVAEENVTLRDFYKLLYNVGQADMLVRDSDNNLVVGNSPFVEYFNMYEIKGILNASDVTSLKDNEVTAPVGMIQVDRSYYFYDGEIPLGYYVDGWARYASGDSPTAVLVKPYKNETFELGLSDLSGKITGNYLYYDVEGTEKKIKIDSPVLLYNGVAAPTMTINDIFDCELGNVTFIDNDSDGSYEVIDIEEYRPVVVSATSTVSMRIIDKNGAAAVELDNSGLVKKYSLTRDGEEISISDISSGELLKVYESAKKTVVRVEAVSNTISGTATSRNESDRSLKIGDTIYKYSEYFAKYYMKDIKVGDEVEVAITEDNIIHAKVSLSSVRNSYGYIISKASYNEDTDVYSLRLACDDGEIRKVKITNKTVMDGVKGESVIKNNVNELFEMSDAVARLIKYRLNDAKDTILVIDSHKPLEGTEEPNTTVYISEKSDNDLTEFSFPKGTTSNPGFKNDSFALLVNLTSSTKVFKLTIADDLEEEEIFQVASKSDIPSSPKRVPKGGTFNDRKYRIYNVDSYGSAEAVVLVSNEAASSNLTKDDTKGIIYRLSEAVNTDGDNVYEAVIYSNGEYKTYFTDEKIYEQIKTGSRKFAQGDYVAYRVNGKEEIYDTKWIYDHDAVVDAVKNPTGAKINPDAMAYTDTEGEDAVLTTPNQIIWTTNAITPGWLYDYDGTNFVLLPTGHFNDNMKSLPTKSADVTSLGKSFIQATSSASYCVVSSTTNGVGIEEIGVADLRLYTQQTDKNKTDFVMVRTSLGVLQEVLIFR